LKLVFDQNCKHSALWLGWNISMVALCRKSCDFNHLRSGTSWTYNSPLLFYWFRSIQDIHSTMLNLFNFVDPNKKDWTIPKKPNKNDCNPPFTQWHNQGCSWYSQVFDQNPSVVCWCCGHTGQRQSKFDLKLVFNQNPSVVCWNFFDLKFVFDKNPSNKKD